MCFNILFPPSLSKTKNEKEARSRLGNGLLVKYRYCFIIITPSPTCQKSTQKVNYRSILDCIMSCFVCGWRALWILAVFSPENTCTEHTWIKICCLWETNINLIKLGAITVCGGKSRCWVASWLRTAGIYCTPWSSHVRDEVTFKGAGNGSWYKIQKFLLTYHSILSFFFFFL